MNDSSAPSPYDAELRELRARAYGPRPDIMDDPDALARLTELESARLGEHASAWLREHPAHGPAHITPQTVVAIESPMPDAVALAGEPAGPRSLSQKDASARTGRIRLVAGSVVVIVAVIFAVTWFASPPPATTLQPTGVDADARILSAVSYAPLAEVDWRTLRGYERYRGLEPWVAENAQGSRCLMAIEAGTLWGIRCAPPEAELMLDLGAWPLDRGAYAAGLADGTVIRFQLHGDSVDAYLFTPPSAD